MNVFDLRNYVIQNYSAFARSFTRIRAQDIADQLNAVYSENYYWPDPLVQINPHFASGKTLLELVQKGLIRAS
jgi:hypothetical protein